MKKILFIHHAAGWGGAPSCMINLIKSLDSSKYDAEVLLLRYSNIADKLAENGIRYKIAESKFYKSYYHFFAHSEAGYVKWYQIYSFIILTISWFLSRYYFAGKELEKHQFDIVHLNSSVLTDWLAPSKKKGKVIIHIREPFRKGKMDILHHFFKSEINKYTDKIVAISVDNARRIGIPVKTKVIYDYAEIPDGLPLKSSYSSKKVLYLGGSSSSKGFYTMVETLDYLDKDVIVYFGGSYVISKRSGSIFKYIKFILSKAKERNAALQKIKNHPNATIIGLVYNVNDYLKEICCLVSPFALPHFSFPVVEAHLQSKSAIGSDVEGMDEIIHHEKNGLIVPKNNPEALAKAIHYITNDSEKAERFGNEGYNIAIQKFTPANVQLFEHVYDHL